MFIAKQGILRRGTVVGAVVTALLTAVTRGEHSTELGSGHDIAVAALCFLEWTIGAGWVIGAAMWSIREQAERRRPRGHLRDR